MGTFIKSRIYCQRNDIKWFHIVYFIVSKDRTKNPKGSNLGKYFFVYLHAQNFVN
jgi:hypothetical protein